MALFFHNLTVSLASLRSKQSVEKRSELKRWTSKTAINVFAVYILVPTSDDSFCAVRTISGHLHISGWRKGGC